MRCRNSKRSNRTFAITAKCAGNTRCILLRLLLTGAATLREARVPVRVEAHRDRLLAVKRGELPWTEVDAWRKDLHREFERALAETQLPERPDYEQANAFLIKARRQMAK